MITAAPVYTRTTKGSCLKKARRKASAARQVAPAAGSRNGEAEAQEVTTNNVVALSLCFVLPAHHPYRILCVHASFCSHMHVSFSCSLLPYPLNHSSTGD